MSGMPGGRSAVQGIPDALAQQLPSLRGDIETKAGKKFDCFEPVSVEQQVVAGINYHVRIKTGDNEYHHVTIWSKLDRTWEVTAASKEA